MCVEYETMAAMKFNKYLTKINQTSNKFAVIHNLNRTMVWRASKLKAIRPATAYKIEAITGGQVSAKDLLLP